MNRNEGGQAASRLPSPWIMLKTDALRQATAIGRLSASLATQTHLVFSRYAKCVAADAAVGSFFPKGS